MNRKSSQRRIGIILAAGALLLAGTAQRSWAWEHAKFVTQLDVFLPGNADETPKDFAQSNAENLVNSSGYSDATVDSTVKAGYGIRVGLMSPVKGFELGGSLGYVLAPNVDTTVNGSSTILGNGSVDREKKTQYVRLLAEAQKKWPVKNVWSLNLGIGLGVAQGHTRDSVSTSGSLSAPGSGSMSKFGFTWEVSPSVSYKAFDIGVRYAGFPKIDGSSSVAGFKWNTFGLFIGAGF